MENKDHSFLYVRGMSERVKKRFKMLCVSEGISMSKKVRKLIELELAKVKEANGRN